MKRELWIQYENKAEFLQEERELYQMIGDAEGSDTVVIYCKAEKAMKRLPANRNVGINPILLGRLTNRYGEKRVKVVEKSIEKQG